MDKDYYKILGIEKDATPDEIKKAYRKMAMKYHPDRNNGSSESESKFKEAAEAYDTLSNPEKRSNYDRFGTSNPSFGGFGGGFNMDDIFSNFGDIFGNAFNNRYQTQIKKGSDLRIKVILSIDDILNGTKRKIKYKRQVKCESCNGEGGSDIEQCKSCNGKGHIQHSQQTPFGHITQSVICNNCNGSGKTVKNKCKICKGEGSVLKEEVVDIEIPAGVSNGMQLSMNGYGNYIKNGINGNLYIIIEEKIDNSYKRDGNNIIMESTISVIDAILGTNINVKSPTGNISINIEPGTEHGKIIRIPKKGIPDIQLGLGDLYIRILIKIPKKIGNDEKKILEKLKDSNNFKI